MVIGDCHRPAVGQSLAEASLSERVGNFGGKDG